MCGAQQKEMYTMKLPIHTHMAKEWRPMRQWYSLAQHLLNKFNKPKRTKSLHDETRTAQYRMNATERESWNTNGSPFDVC